MARLILKSLQNRKFAAIECCGYWAYILEECPRCKEHYPDELIHKRNKINRIVRLCAGRRLIG